MTSNFITVPSLLTIILTIVVLLGLLLLLLLLKVHHSQRMWQRRGIPTIPSAVPILGNFGELMLKRLAFPYVVQGFHNDIKKMGLQYAGIYQFMRPQLWLVDLDIIRDVTVRYFDHFTDRRPFVSKSADELLGRSLLSLQGEEWRDMRHTLSPAFTGAKLRGMIPLIETTCQEFASFLAKRPNPEEPLDIFEISRRFAADVIASTAFGTVSNSLNNEDDPFYKYGKTMMDVNTKRSLILMGYLLSPWMMQKLGIPFTPNELTQFFHSTIITAIKHHEDLYRPDMVQLMLDARKKEKVNISVVDIVAQAFTFFLGGFDTIAAAISFCCLLLAMHPDVQEKLRDEVDEAFEQNKGHLGHESIKKLTYMDMVLSEVLRLYPPAPMVDRMCSKSFIIPEHNLVIEKGTSVAFSIFGLHHDPEYFRDPERFDPDRFSEENKENIQASTYLPFGSGPRNCIANRFAQIEVKMALAYIISAVELDVSEKTQIPIRISKDNTQMKPEGGFWITTRPRKNKQQ